MKKFNEIPNFKTLRCEAKISEDKLTILHYRINEIIFKYNMQSAFPINVQKATEQLVVVFQQIKELEVKDAVKPKQEEISYESKVSSFFQGRRRTADRF